MRSPATRALRQGPDPAMAEMLQQCNGLALPEHGNDLDLVTYDYCMAEMKLQLHEFDLISLKLVNKPDELTKLGFKQEHATAIVSAVHEHIACFFRPRRMGLERSAGHEAHFCACGCSFQWRWLWAWKACSVCLIIAEHLMLQHTLLWMRCWENPELGCSYGPSIAR